MNNVIELSYDYNLNIFLAMGKELVYNNSPVEMGL